MYFQLPQLTPIFRATSVRLGLVSLLFALIFLMAGCVVESPEAADPDGASAVALASATPRPPTPTSTPTPIPPPFDLRQTDNLLLLGTDRRGDSDRWRTDSIMVIGIDRRFNRAAVFSIPRDLYVSVPGYGQSRINQVDYLGERVLTGTEGGPALVSQVLQAELGLSTKHWVRIEMEGFRSLVDALGGVTVALDCPFYELIFDLDENRWTFFELPAGDVLMDGETAYRFVTLRLIESDFGRSRRQRQFLWALRNQAIDSGLLLKVPELWDAFQQTFKTDLSLLQMLDLARFGLGIEPDRVRSGGIGASDLERYITANGADVLRVSNPDLISAAIDRIWSGESLAATNRLSGDACPPPPRNVPSYVNQIATPTPPPTPEAEAIVNENTPTANGEGD